MKRMIRKRRVARAALFLAVFMFLSVFQNVSKPMAAAAFHMKWHDGEKETAISVEAGSKFYIGDFVSIYSETTSATASLVKATYRSTNKKAATVNGKGYLNAKKAGETDITVSYQGKSLTCHLTVEKKGAFEKSSAVTELKKAAETLAKGMPKKLTAAKGPALRKKKENYFSSYGGTSAKKLSYDGFLYQMERDSMSTMNSKRSEKLAVPQAGRYLTAEALLRQFQLTNDPTSLKSKKTMSVTSASAGLKSGKITVKLSKKITADQIFAAQLAFPALNSSTDSGKKKANISMTVYDESAGNYYQGRLTLQKGSRQAAVQIMATGYGGYQKAELRKGHVYMLGSELSWAKGYKVTVK